MEGYYFNQGAARFEGFPGVSNSEIPLALGYNSSNSISLAPAIEYSFSENYGIIGGGWFSVSGNSATKFSSVVISFSANW